MEKILITEESVAKYVDIFLNQIKEDSKHRFLSWEHCHNTFLEYKGKSLTEKDLEFLALHLAFYLASWGMYRGSSFLLQHYDYTVHIQAVKIAMEYTQLFDINPLRDRDTYLNLLFGKDGVYTKLSNYYSDLHQKALGINNSYDSSITLITKILLGIFGCIPAYDDFFKKALSYYNIKQTSSKRPAIESLIDHINNNKEVYDAFNVKLKNINSKRSNYTFMKLADMYFWQIGKEIR